MDPSHPPAKRARLDDQGRISADADLRPIRDDSKHDPANRAENKEAKQASVHDWVVNNQSDRARRTAAFERLCMSDGLRSAHLCKAGDLQEWYFLNKTKRGSTSPQSAMLSFCHNNMPSSALRVRWHKVKFTANRSAEHYQNFGVFANPADYIDVVTKARETRRGAIAKHTVSFYELIEENTPCALYFDVEKSQYPMCPTSGDHTAVINAIHFAVRQTFDKLGHLPKVADALLRRAIVCADRQEDDGDWKLSLHIHYPGIVFANNHVDMLQFQKLMVREVPVPTWDMAVYTKNRTFRMPYSNKAGNPKTVLLPMHMDPDGLWHVASEYAPTDAQIMHQAFIRRAPGDVNVPSTLFVAPVRPPVPADNIAVSAQADVSDEDGLNDVERRFVVSVFRAFLAHRVQKFNVVAQFPVAPVLRTHNNKLGVLYMNVPEDRYCEHKGRPHENSSGTQQGYAVDFCKQLVYQTCFACRGSQPIRYSFAPGQRYPLMQVSMPIYLWQSMMDGEYMMRDLFVREYGFKLKSTPSATFTKETDTLWAFDDDRRVWSRELSAKLCDWIHTWIRGKNRLVMALDPPPADIVEDWQKALTKFKSSPAVRSMRNCVPSAVISHDFEEQLHSQHHLIPMDDGNVVDVGAGGLVRPRTMSDYFSDYMPFHLVPDDHPDLEEVITFMREYANNNPDLYEDLHRQLGYAMSGWTYDRKFYFWLGNGANAKGTVSAALSQVMGGFFAQSAQAFMSKRGNANMTSEQASPALAGMRFKRVVMLSETPKDCELDTAQLKGLVSGDPQTCRELYKQAMTYTPQFKVIIQTNFVPTTLDVTDQALLDRFNLTPFLTRYANQPRGKELKKDPTRRDHFLSLKDAFGTWCVKGAIKAAKDGFRSLRVSAIGKELQEQELEKLDQTAIFLRGHAEFGSETYKWGSDHMFEVFRAWCARRNHKCYVDINAFEAEIISKAQGERVILEGDVFVGMRQIIRGVNEAPVHVFVPPEQGDDGKDEAEPEGGEEMSFGDMCKGCNKCKPHVLMGYCQECRHALSE